eukprot:scaffold647863_cov40-Prasinocladus_malaysianus.AAC.1
MKPAATPLMPSDASSLPIRRPAKRLVLSHCAWIVKLLSPNVDRFVLIMAFGEMNMFSAKSNMHLATAIARMRCSISFIRVRLMSEQNENTCTSNVMTLSDNRGFPCCGRATGFFKGYPEAKLCHSHCLA